MNRYNSVLSATGNTVICVYEMVAAPEHNDLYVLDSIPRNTDSDSNTHEISP